jgi:hypothetical protein
MDNKEIFTLAPGIHATDRERFVMIGIMQQARGDGSINGIDFIEQHVPEPQIQQPPVRPDSLNDIVGDMTRDAINLSKGAAEILLKGVFGLFGKVNEIIPGSAPDDV